jgi:predicted site-specific integrase-resolvase
MIKRKRVAIYARVSTDKKGQDPENQLQQLLQLVRPYGLRGRPRIRRT